MSLLGKPQILRLLEAGEIVIDPFHAENLGSAQYDVTLGEHCYREVEDTRAIYNPFDEQHVRAKWQISRGIRHGEMISDLGVKPFKNIGLDEKVILVQPGEIILAHTEEFIGGRTCVTTMMKARSSLGRNCVEVCRCAGMGDVGFFNRWALEIVNTSRFQAIPLVVGRRVAQILFFDVGEVEAADRYERAGKYQTSTSVEELRARWKPEAMLPKQWADHECRSVQHGKD